MNSTTESTQTKKTRRPWKRNELLLVAAPVFVLAIVALIYFIPSLFWQWRPVKYVPPQNVAVEYVQFLPDGRSLLGAGSHWHFATPQSPMSSTIFLWDVETRQILWRIRLNQWTSAPSISPDGKLIAATMSTGGKGMVTYCWDAATGQRLWSRFEKAAAMALRFSPDSKYLIVYTDQPRIRDARTGNLHQIIKTDLDGFSHIYYSPYDSIITLLKASSRNSTGEKIQFWSVKQNKLIQEIPLESVKSFYWLTKDLFLTAQRIRPVEGLIGGGEIRLWDLKSGKPVGELGKLTANWTIDQRNQQIIRSEYLFAQRKSASDSTYKDSNIPQTKIEAIDYITKKINWSKTLPGKVENIKCSPNNAFVAAGATIFHDKENKYTFTIYIFKTANGQIAGQIPIQLSPATLTFSPDSKKFAVSGTVWDISHLEP